MDAGQGTTAGTEFTECTHKGTGGGMSMAEDTRKRPDFSSDNSSQPSRDSANDPLAELARLIGQNDPFNDVGKRSVRKPLESVKNENRPAPEWLARPAPPSEEYDEPHQPGYAAPARYQAEPYAPAAPPAEHDTHSEHDRYAAGHAAHDQHAYQAQHDDSQYRAADENYQPDDRYRVALPGQYEGDSYYAEDGHMPPHGEESATGNRRRGGIITIAAVLGLAVIGTAGAFGYRAFTSGSGTASTPPVIKADPTPAKTVPAPATTASTDAQQGKPFQDRISALASGERVVPREEQPVSLPIAPPATPRAMAPQPSAQAVSPLVSPPTPTTANEPKRVKTIAIRPDNGGGDTGTISSAPGANPSASAKVPPPAKQSNSGPMAIAPQSEPAAPNARTKLATRSPAPAASGAYVVQVSAQRTEAEAQSSYQTLQSKYPSVLGSRNANIKRVDLGDKGGVFFRAQVGSFATSEQATAFCNSLKDAGGQCIVQKN
jgi:hypothetical protein